MYTTYMHRPCAIRVAIILMGACRVSGLRRTRNYTHVLYAYNKHAPAIRYTRGNHPNGRVPRQRITADAQRRVVDS